MKYILSCCLLLLTFYLHADVPGNKPRPSYDVKITGLNQYNNHLFFFQDNNVVSRLNDSSSIHIPGGYGAPRCIEVWAINKNNLIHTDTLLFCSGDEKKSKTITVNIYQKHLTYSTVETKGKKQNSIPFSNVNNFRNDNDPFNKNRNIMYLISSISFIILAVMLLLVLRQKREIKLQTIV